jgi:hypothetical protein
MANDLLTERGGEPVSKH